MKIKPAHALCLIAFLLSGFQSKTEAPVQVDICIYGGTSAGIIAAYTAQKLGKSVIVVEPGNYIGGLTTGGLGATDIGNKYAVTGLAKDFYRRIGAYYGKFEQWTFEPHVADKVYADLIREAGLNIVKNHRLKAVKKDGAWIREITVESAVKPAVGTNRIIRAKMFIDCTYEGDLMARAGVSYTTGRESNSQYGETYNGVQLSEFHQLPDHIDPYRIEGNAKSGLVWGVGSGEIRPTGSGDKTIQAYNFRLCLTQDKQNLIPFTKPENYNRSQFELLSRILKKEAWTTIHSSFKVNNLADGKRAVDHQGGFLIKNMPNGKTDFNNFGGFSTDMIGANYDYPEGDYATRKKIWQAHVDYTKGLLYFLSHDEVVPAHIRSEMKSWGYPRDEFKDLGGFPNQLYVREARRMVGELVMTQKHCEGQEVATEQIGMAAYSMDSHNCQRLVINGMVKNEGDVQKSVRYPFPISYRAITPKASECKNLLVPVCLSASHIAFGSIRMEPVFMVLGQSAATAAVQAINEGQEVQKLDVAKLQRTLSSDPLADGRSPEILVDNDDLQKVTVRGSWRKGGGGYGKDVLVALAEESAHPTVRYNPDLSKGGQYEIFAYFPNIEKRSEKAVFLVGTATGQKEVVISSGDIKRIGLSSGEWVSLGTHELGTSAFVEIAGNANGNISADAIIWKPLNK
jgi:hypothetical protein